VPREFSLSLRVCFGDTNRLHEAHAIWILRNIEPEGRLPETFEDASSRKLGAEPAEVVEAEIVLKRELKGRRVPNSGNPHRRRWLLKRSRPNIDARVLSEFSIPGEGRLVSPSPEDQWQIFVETRSDLDGRHTVVDAGVVKESNRKAGDQATAADAVDHCVLLGNTDRLSCLAE
jgi:hypothetical protein